MRISTDVACSSCHKMGMQEILMTSSLDPALAILILRFIDEVPTSAHSHRFLIAEDLFSEHIFVPEPASY